MTTSIPLVDISKCGLLIENDKDISEQDFRDVGNQLQSALSTLGAAYLSNHGIPWSDVDHLNKAADAFFDQPEEVKRRLCTHNLVFDYDPAGKSKVDAKHHDQQEGLRVAGEAYEDETIEWPDIPRFKETYFGFSLKAGHLLLRLLKALGFGLKLKDKDHFGKVHSLMNKTGNFTILKTARYPPAPTDDMLPEHKLRLGAHCDITTLSILFQDAIGGLQVEVESGKFIDVEPIPGTIVVNVGEMLQAWTGNKLKAALHRVCPPGDIEKRDEIRRSVIYFGQANSDELMAKMEFEDEDDDDICENAKEPLTVVQFMNKKFDDLMK